MKGFLHPTGCHFFFFFFLVFFSPPSPFSNAGSSNVFAFKSLLESVLSSFFLSLPPFFARRSKVLHLVFFSPTLFPPITFRVVHSSGALPDPFPCPGYFIFGPSLPPPAEGPRRVLDFSSPLAIVARLHFDFLRTRPSSRDCSCSRLFVVPSHFLTCCFFLCGGW